MGFWRSAAGALALALIVSTANAQVPGPASPDRIEERFKTPLAPQSVPEIIIPATGAAPPPGQAAQTMLVLQGVTLEGVTVYQASQLQHLYGAMLGKPVSLLDIYRLRDAVTAQYRSDGYVLSQAIIPPQTISGGVVRLQVVEGYVAGVTLESDARDRRGLIGRIAEKIKSSRPLRARDLERYVLLIDDLPGVSVNTVLKPSEVPGASNLVVVIKRTPTSGSFTADNRGSQAIGPEQLSGAVEANSWFGLQERTGLQFATTAQTRELRYYALHHDELLSSEGLKLSLSASVSRSHSGGAISVLDPFGNGETYRVRLSEPLIRSRSRTFTLGGGLTALNSTTHLLGAPFSEDRVRFAYVDGAFDFADTALGSARPATTILSVELDRGLNILDATRTGTAGLSRANGKSDFTKLYAEATRVQSLSSGVSIAVSAAAQISADPLLSSQQFGLGGGRFGRGYEPSELTGDEGVALSIEGRVSPWSQGLNGIAPQLYAFYEGGEVRQKKPLAGERSHASLASAGVGVRFAIGRHFHAEFELSKPLTRDVASQSDKDLRPLFAVSTTF